MSTDTQIAKQLTAGEYGSTPMSDPVAEAKKQRQRVWTLVKPADAGATTAFDLAIVLDRPVRIISAAMVVAANVSADSTNAVTEALVTSDNAGGSAVTIGSFTTASTGLTAQIPRALALTAANVDLAVANNLLRWQQTKAASGTSVGAATLTIIAEEI